MTDTTRTPDNTPDAEPLAFDERTRRVMELQKQVREGTYRPDPEEVAKALLEHWADAGDVAPRETPAPSIDTAAERLQVAARFVIERSVPEHEAGARTA